MPIKLGTLTSGKSLAMGLESFKTHVAAFGMTGSGKTGLVLGVVEELVRSKVPVVILDVKGDMANLFLQSDTALLDSMLPKFITPGADHGESVNITAGLQDPGNVSSAVSALLKLLNIRGAAHPLSGQHTYLSEILKVRHAKGHDCGLKHILDAVQNPPFDEIGSMDLDKVISEDQRDRLAARLNSMLVTDSFKHWRGGTVLDIRELVATSETGRTPVVIYSVAHLQNEEDRQFAISLLMEAMVTYMRQCQGTAGLNSVFVVDECWGLMPPRRENRTKELMLTMLKMGRSVGLGLVLATQNPMDLEYKGMANIETWIIGMLQTENDRKRLIEGAGNAAGVSKNDLTKQIAKLQKRQFLVARNKRIIPFRSREVSCHLAGVMNPESLRELFSKELPSATSPQPSPRLAEVVNMPSDNVATEHTDRSSGDEA